MADKLKVKMFLDSGVFSAWGRGETLDLQAYIDFIKRNEWCLSCYATMDVIPGEFGTPRTRQQVEQSANGSYANTQKMKEAGLKPIPIFHQGEGFEWLERMLSEGETYIGISTAKDVTAKEQSRWLDHVYSVITDKNGVPYVKTHGFGITAVPLMLRYPWFTCDSTTWSLAAGYGLVYVPGFRKDGTPDYSQYTRIIMSGRVQAAWSSRKRQYEALGDLDKAHVDRWLDHLGITSEQARYMSSKRREACIKYFLGFTNEYKIKPFKHRHGAPIKRDRRSPRLQEHMTIIFATMLSNGQFSQIMNEAGATSRLVSYYELIGKSDKPLQNYCVHGIDNLDYKRRAARHDWTDDSYTAHRRMTLLGRIMEQRDGQAEFD